MAKRIAVIGGGPAGLMAALTAASHKNETLLLEKGEKVGRKLDITGKGRCNITNYCDVPEIIANIPGNGSFLFSALSRFSSYDIIAFFEECGISTKVERGNRVFPVSDNAKDISDALYKKCIDSGVSFLFNKRAKSIDVFNNHVCAVRLNDGSKIECDAAIIATGGMSYPGTGSTGDGYKMASELGHGIIKPRASLVPLISESKFIPSLQGLTLKNVSIRCVHRSGKLLYQDFGEMLFTHFGVSGPLILSASRHLLDYDYNNIDLVIDLKPALTNEQLEKRIQRDMDMYSRKLFSNSLGDLLPKKLIPVIVSQMESDPDKLSNQLTKSERTKLAYLLKGFTVSINGCRPIAEAIITAGGIPVTEINPSTMESKIIKGLFFAGEVIDTDAYTGGFNLTIAFSTGYTAGLKC